MENGSAFAWASLLVWVFFQPNQQLLSLISSLLKEQQCRRIQKEHLRVESFFQRKNISFYVSECHESQRTVLMVARHCHGWQCHTWLRAWWIPAALEIPQSLSHTHPRTLQAGLPRTCDWEQHRAPCLHVCYTCALPAGLFFCLYCSCLQLGIMFGGRVLIFCCFFNVATKADIFSFPCML